MDFAERLEALSKKVSLVSSNLLTEEATKNALVMPFLHNVLGYDCNGQQKPDKKLSTLFKFNRAFVAQS